jgi:hypothetical protein
MMRRRVMPTLQPKKPARKIAEREHLMRNGVITAWSFDLSAHGASGPSFPTRWGKASLSALGNFSEPVNGIAAFDIMFSGVDPGGVEDAPAVGMFLRAKPVLDGHVYLPWRDLEALMVFAAADKALHCCINFEKPRYGSGAIFSFSMSTKPLE